MSLEILYLLIMVAAALATFILVPGPVVIAATAWVYGFQTGFEKFTVWHVVVFALLALFSLALDNLLALIGTKKYGGSNFALVGAVVGFIFGTLLLGPLGLILGPFLGAYLGEVLGTQKSSKHAVKAAMGTVIGLLTGVIAKGVLALGMVAWFALIVF
ncbi:MAG: DUF456 domain-containing protein [Patescibacteria group bacterium]